MQEFKEKIVSDAFWLKTIFVLLYFVVYRVLDIVLLLVTIGQWLFTLFTGEPNAGLRNFGASLGIYLQQITYFLTSVSDQKPFPFQDWPNAELNDDETE